MFKKVFEDNGQLKSMNDKGTSCILLLSGLLTIIENIRCKLLALNDLELLEQMVTFSRRIYNLVARFTEKYSIYTLRAGHKKPTSFYPLIRQARQMEVFSLLCDMTHMLNEFKKDKFFYTCNKVFIMNVFVVTLKPSLAFLKKFLLKHKHFHVILHPPTRSQNGFTKNFINKWKNKLIIKKFYQKNILRSFFNYYIHQLHIIYLYLYTFPNVYTQLNKKNAYFKKFLFHFIVTNYYLVKCDFLIYTQECYHL